MNLSPYNNKQWNSKLNNCIIACSDINKRFINKTEFPVTIAKQVIQFLMFRYTVFSDKIQQSLIKSENTR